MTRRPRQLWIAAGTLTGLAAAAITRGVAGDTGLTHTILLVTLAGGGLPLVTATVAGLLRGRFAADVVAALAIAGALLLGEYFAGTIIVLMQAGGEALDAYAMQRASQTIEALLRRAPTIAHRRRAGAIEDVAVAAVAVGDELALRPGELVPVDCAVLEGRSSVDQSALTGEPLPLAARPGVELMSGSVNLEGALVVRATRVAGDSQYQQIVRLVEAARTAKAPIQRLADRFAVWFTPLTLLVCGLAWLVDHDLRSVLAVLVVATPCPLILATPVAMIAGIGRAARRGIIVRHGGALEEIGRTRLVVFDKTGTLTLGTPVVQAVEPAPGFEAGELLRLAGSVEQLSSHHLGQAVAAAARGRGLALSEPRDFHEEPGRGVRGRVDGRDVAVGSSRWLAESHAATSLDGTSAATAAHVLVDGSPAGRIVFADRMRSEVPDLMRALSGLGLGDTVMLTGDHLAAAAPLARDAGIASVRADLLPAGKVEALGELRRAHGHVVMVGDGINDAPALAAASVGIAMGAHAPAAAAQAADIVLLVDDVSRVAEAIAIGRDTRRIALQSIGWGLGVSGLLMLVASLGYLAPAVGAVCQEALDVAVILNALRAR